MRSRRPGLRRLAGAGLLLVLSLGIATAGEERPVRTFLLRGVRVTLDDMRRAAETEAVMAPAGPPSPAAVPFMRGPGPLPSGRSFIAAFLIGWGVFNMLECIARHDIVEEWLIFATGLGFVLLGGILIWTRVETVVERRSGSDRRSASPLR